MSFNCEPRKGPGFYDTLLYIFGSVVRSVGQVQCLVKLWNLEVFGELPRMGSIFWVLVEAIPGFVTVS